MYIVIYNRSQCLSLTMLTFSRWDNDVQLQEPAAIVDNGDDEDENYVIPGRPTGR